MPRITVEDRQQQQLALINPMARILTVGEKRILQGMVVRRDILAYMRSRPGGRPVTLPELKEQGVKNAAEHLDRLIKVGKVVAIDGGYALNGDDDDQ